MGISVEQWIDDNYLRRLHKDIEIHIEMFVDDKDAREHLHRCIMISLMDNLRNRVKEPFHTADHDQTKIMLPTKER